MFTNTQPDAQASTASPAQANAPIPEYETVRHLLFGSLTAVRLVIQDLHRKRYAEPNDWSKPISTGRPNEVMAILTRSVRVN